MAPKELKVRVIAIMVSCSFDSKPYKLMEQRLFEQDCEGTHRTCNKGVHRKVLRTPAPTAAPLFRLRVWTDPFPERVIFGIQKDGKFQKLGNPKLNIPSSKPFQNYLRWSTFLLLIVQPDSIYE